MTDTRLLNVDLLSGVRRWFHGEDDGSFTIEEIEDVEPLMDFNKAQHNDAPEFGRFKGDQVKVASIPASVVADLINRGIWGDQERMKAWLNDRDNQVFRTTPGKL